MSHRKVIGLEWVVEHEGPRAFTAKRRRPRGSKGAGVKFERELAKKLGAQARHGQWFQFYDLNGIGFAQTDFLLFAPDAVFCIEAKLGNISAGEEQFRELYKPLLERYYALPAFGIVIARHLSDNPLADRTVQTLFDATRLSRSGTCVLQWRERLPLAVPPGLGPRLIPQSKAPCAA